MDSNIKIYKTNVEVNLRFHEDNGYSINSPSYSCHDMGIRFPLPFISLLVLGRLKLYFSIFINVWLYNLWLYGIKCVIIQQLVIPNKRCGYITCGYTE